MNPSELVSVAELSSSDKEVVEQFLRSKEQLTDLIPDTMDSQELWRSLAACCKSLSIYRKSASVLKVIVGRLLVVLQDRPEVYQKLSYRNFDDFLTRGMPELFGIPRSEAYAARALIAKWPSLSSEQIKQVSYSKISLISQFTHEGDVNANKFLQAAQTLTLDKLKDYCANQGMLPREESDLAEISLLTTKGIKDQWLEFSSDPHIQAFVGTDNPGEILSMAIAEVSADWMSRAMHKKAIDVK